MSIASEIKKRLANQKPTAAQGKQAEISKQMQTLQTGKTAGGPMARTSNIGESVANQQAVSTSGQIKQDSMMAAEGLAGAEENVNAQLAQGQQELGAQKQMADQQQATQLTMADNARMAQMDENMAKLDANDNMTINRMNAQADSTIKQLESEKNMTVNEIWGSFERSNTELAFREDAAAMEQIAFDMRLKDQKYVDHITRVGKFRGLEDELAFRKEATELAFGESYKLLQQNATWSAAYDRGTREFAEEMGGMSLEAAMAVYNSQSQAAGIQAVASGISTTAQNVDFSSDNSWEAKEGVSYPSQDPADYGDKG